jgi:hypothetical protein
MTMMSEDKNNVGVITRLFPTPETIHCGNRTSYARNARVELESVNSFRLLEGMQ